MCIRDRKSSKFTVKGRSFSFPLGKGWEPEAPAEGAKQKAKPSMEGEIQQAVLFSGRKFVGTEFYSYLCTQKG